MKTTAEMSNYGRQGIFMCVQVCILHCMRNGSTQKNKPLQFQNILLCKKGKLIYNLNNFRPQIYQLSK